MACFSTALAGSTLDCGSIGGLKEVHLIASESVNESAGTITAGVLSGVTLEAGKSWAEYEFRNGNANFVPTGNVDDAAGTAFVETVLTLQINKMDAAKQAELSNMFGKLVKAVAVDQNGVKWYLGYGSYGYASVSGQSGANKGDSNNYVVTITFQTAGLPLTVASLPVAS